MKYITELTVFTHGNSTYIAATGNHDDGFSVFSFDGSALTHVATVKDTDNDDYALLGLYSIHSFVQGGTTYLAAGSVSDVQDSNNVDRGFTVFSFDGTALTHTVTVRLDRAKSYLLWIPWQLTSFVHGENTYLAVADYGYSGLGIYNLDGGTISHAATVLERDNPDLYALDRSVAVTKFEHRGNTYLVVGGQSSGDGINLFGFDGSTLHHVQTIVDSDNPVYELNDVSDVTSFVYNGSPYIAVSAHTDHGMSVFKVE